MIQHIQPQKSKYTVWEVDSRLDIPTDNSKYYKPHMYVIISDASQTTKGNIITALPISTDKINKFSLPISYSMHSDFLENDSHILCDHIVTFRENQLVNYLGDITNTTIHDSITANIVAYLDLI
ncbi:MAG: type II toxin-antitoxin system PemK/MazF family toxin [Deltaproteobacteria bacterium]|nr:type II toxin-antitoxin system PemK/MazF family toxin [Deltaproteobacteria bacterium]